MAIYRCRSCTADVLHNSKMKQNTGTTLSLFPASLSLVSVSPASLSVAEMGVSYCAAWCCQGFISSPQSETCLSKPCVRVCLCACRTISLAQQLQERAQNILFAPFPRQPVHEVLFCVRIWDACMCVCICEHAPCRLCYATDSELTWTWLSACLSYDRGVLSAKTTSPSTQEKQWYLCQWTVVVLLLHEFSFLQFCSSD